MKLTNLKIKQTYEALTTLDKKLPVVVNFALLHNLKQLEDIYNIYSKQRNSLIFQYADKDDKGNVIISGNTCTITSEDDKKTMNQKLNELDSIAVDINIQQVDKKDLMYSDSQYDILSTQELRCMEFMIRED